MVDLYGFHVGNTKLVPWIRNLNPNNDLQVLASAESARKLFKTLGDKPGIPSGGGKTSATVARGVGGYSHEGFDLTTA